MPNPFDIRDTRRIGPSAMFLAAVIAIALSACERTGRENEERMNAAKLDLEKKTNEAKQESTTKITSAQAEVDKKIAETNADFVKMREDYRSKLTSKFADNDKTIQKLEATQKTATGAAKAQLEAALPDIRAKRDTLRRDMGQIDAVTMPNWDAAKSQLDSDMDGLKAALERASPAM